MDSQSLKEAYFEVYSQQFGETSETLSEEVTEDSFDIQEGEGSYGKTPKAREAMGKVAIARREKPASEYSQKGEKTKKVKEIEKHTRRIDNGPDVGDRGKKSTRPRRMVGRGKLDQDARDYAREDDVEYGYGTHGSGTVTKNPKKLRKQKALGEIEESHDAYSAVLSHLLDEGYASTESAADKIILNMSEAWFENIMELNRYEKETGKDYKTGKEVTKGGTMGGDDTQSKVMRHMHKVMGAGRMGAGGAIEPRGKKKEKGKKPPKAGEYGSERESPEQTVKKRRASAERSREMQSSRFD